MRLLFGLDRVPSSLPFDDPRLPGVELGATPLRLNTVPVPPAILGEAGVGHEARLDAMLGWLQAQCGNYAVAERRFMADYLAGIAAQIEADRQELAALLQPFGGLYAAEDWLWSALRPLPRAWQLTPQGPARLGTIFWDGQGIIPAVAHLPSPRVWVKETLPRSPFRRHPIAPPQHNHFSSSP